MKKYVVNIGPISNILSDPNFFFGTGFWGEGIDSHEELKEIIKKYWKDKDGHYRPLKLTFSLGTNVAKAQEAGNQQAAKGETVNMFSVLSHLSHDPLRGMKLYFSGYGFKGHGNSYWMLEDTRHSESAEMIFFPGKKLSEVLPEIGVIL